MDLDRLRRALAGIPEHAPTEGVSQAAVAAVLRRDGDAGAPELLFIRRADHPLDPWSGHMAFPGGRVDPGDASPLAAAIRETREEIGLDLETTAALAGRLPRLPVTARGRRLPMVIEPFVFTLARTPPLLLNHEVEEVVWVPLAYLAEPANRASFLWQREELSLTLPCCDWQGRRIWGMTLRMADDLISRLG